MLSRPDTPRRSGIPALILVDRDGKELVFNARDVVDPARIAQWVEEDMFAWAEA